MKCIESRTELVVLEGNHLGKIVGESHNRSKKGRHPGRGKKLKNRRRKTQFGSSDSSSVHSPAQKMEDCTKVLRKKRTTKAGGPS